jgi:hypothetical protein
MKIILAAAAIASFVAFPALAQSTDGASTAGAPVVPPATQASPDRMGTAATTGDTTAAPSTGMPKGAMAPMGEDSTSTGSIQRSGEPDGTSVQTEGMDPSAASAAQDNTPSNGIVPGQSSN